MFTFGEYAASVLIGFGLTALLVLAVAIGYLMKLAWTGLMCSFRTMAYRVSASKTSMNVTSRAETGSATGPS